MAWASPVEINEQKNSARTITPLLRSSSQSWLSSSTDVMPKMTRQGVSAFTPEGEQKSHLLGLVNAGRFDSYFAGKNSPLIDAESKNEAATQEEGAAQDDSGQDNTLDVSSVIERSPDSARIILFSSNEFLNDQVLQMLGSAQQTSYVNSVQMLANAIDWSLEDSGLLSIRSRGHFNRTLPPMEKDEQMFWEYLNYALAALAIIAIAVWERRRRAIKHKRYFDLLAV